MNTKKTKDISFNFILEEFFKLFDIYPREYFIIGFFLLFSFSIVSTVFSYTVLNNDFYKSLADKQQLSEVSIPVTRGTIYSSTNSGTVLSTSVNLYDVAVDPQMLWDKAKLQSFLRDLVYKQLCYLSTEEDCYVWLLKFLNLLEIPNFTKDEKIIKNLIEERLRSKLSKSQVTSVLLAESIETEKSIQILNLSMKGVYVNENNVFLNPEEIVDVNYVVKQLSSILIIPPEDIEKAAKKRAVKYIPIISRISIWLTDEVKKYLDEEKQAMKKWILDEENSIGNFIILEPQASRFYPEKQIGSQVVWFVDNAGVWHYWLEWYFNELLAGESWKIVSRKDIAGRIIDPISFDKNDILWAWVDIYTTIDRNVQRKVEEILEAWVKNYRANKATIVVMDPRTGEVIAMASAPSFDANTPGDVYEIEKVSYLKYPNPAIDLLWKVVFVEDNERGEEYYYDNKKLYLRAATNEELWNLALVKYKYKNDFWAGVYKNDAVSGLYEPGSIMKAMTVAIGIDTGEIERYDMYNDTGEVRIDNFTIKNVSSSCLWYKSFANALNFSCNVWMIRIAQRVGKALFFQYLNDFGFWKPTWITFDGEISRSITPYEKWSRAQLFTSSYWLWIGATPLQMATAYSVIANGGVYVRPMIVKKLVFENGRTIEYKPEVTHRVIKESTSKTVTAMLVDSVVRWVAKSWWVAWYSVAGKTGTAQIARPGWYEIGPASTIASYAWFAPAEDPKFVVIVKLERSRVDQFWSTTAAIMFKDVTTYLLDYYSIPQRKQEFK
jgi:stage V sporulation protein D (sporulation-specific penicillin-binding protein)